MTIEKERITGKGWEEKVEKNEEWKKARMAKKVMTTIKR